MFLSPKSVDRDPEDVEYPGHILEPGWIRLSSAVICLGFEERQAVNIPQQQDISGDRQSGERLKDEPHGAILRATSATSNKDRKDLAAYRVFCLLQELGEAKHLDEVTMLRIEHRHKEIEGSRITLEKDDKDQLLLIEALRKMMQPPFTPWWSRIWTVQEIAVAQTILVVYGTMSAPGSLFACAAGPYIHHSTSCCSESVTRLSTDQAKVLADCCNRILGIEELQMKTQRHDSGGMGELEPDWSLLELLRKFRDRRATDPRDKVYALLNLIARSGTSTEIIPDYTLSEIEVYSRATLVCIRENSNLSVFSTDLGRKFRDDLPSWVPDWGAPGGLFYEARAAATELYTLGSIDYACEIQWGGDIREIWRDTLSHWGKTVTKFDNEYMDSRLHQRADINYQRALLPVIDRSIMTATISRTLIMSRQHIQYSQHRQHIGLRPANTQVGDKIFLLEGGKTPFVLRETDHEPTITGPKFEIIGDCYLHGAMDWERNPFKYYDWEKITIL
ncbi:hypothetical protein SNOG_04125 [Parastagonospora nodorum SN15]|uniref:Heterokaryon incompatibility domain-containing protein n=2 Tax=Phaeosphaeria nodorum (strain SN15 / ATCC MYA-4574 / FGSC 10173) TaxID=321614 RepID=Q0UVT9_PHANO|nr:hypothetical protein SNOG_04125 [Parastagonospora nodorum SN15]EAT87885.1 hypothetical protein SNOG_04125 [Parastagonospora nodorum SN15]